MAPMKANFPELIAESRGADDDLPGAVEGEASAHAGNVDAPGRRVGARLPLALNAPEGAWTLRPRDVVSGVTTFRRFEVAPAG